MIMKKAREYARFAILPLLLAALLLAPSCKKDGPKETTTPHTLIFYFTGTELSYYFYRNISAAKDAIRQNIMGRSRVVCFFQHTDKTKADLIELVYVEGSCEEKVLATYDLPKQMDREHLSYFFNEIVRSAPADSYGLVMAGHALAWIPVDAAPFPRTMRRAAGTAAAEHAAQSGDDFWRKAQSDIVTRHFGEKYSDTQSNIFDIETLSSALASTGVKFDYILFDACFMANVESVYDLRDNADYIIGAPCEILGDGFPYQNALPYLLRNGGRSHDLLQVCKAFHDQYASKFGYSGSVALIDCAQMNALAEIMKKINSGATKDYDRDEIQTFEGQSRHVFYDLGDYVDKMCGDPALKALFDAQMSRTVPCKYTLGSFWSNYGDKSALYPITAFSGLSTSAPSEVYRDDYAETSWYKATR